MNIGSTCFTLAGPITIRYAWIQWRIPTWGKLYKWRMIESRKVLNFSFSRICTPILPAHHSLNKKKKKEITCKNYKKDFVQFRKDRMYVVFFFCSFFVLFFCSFVSGISRPILISCSLLHATSQAGAKQAYFSEGAKSFFPDFFPAWNAFSW